MTQDRRTPPLRATWLTPLLLLAWAGLAAAQAEGPRNSLEAVDHAVLPGDRVELRFEFAAPVAEPRSFTIRDPARLALDFRATANATGQRHVELGIGPVLSLDIAEARDRTRVVLNLSEIPKHTTRVDGGTVVVTLGATGGGSSGAQAGRTGAPFTGQASGTSPAGNRVIESIDFRRGDEGQGRVLIDLSDPDTPVNIERRGNQVVVELAGTRIPEELRKRLDVLDFATPVQYIDAVQQGDTGHIRITPRTDDYEQLAYQSGDAVTIELKEREEERAQVGDEPTYTGEKLSLNFQDIEVRAVLQLLADFTGLNIVVSDSVGGSLTLRLKNVPWDQALDIVLRTRGLGKRRSGNVMFIAPSQELAAREQAQLEAQQKEAELAPLRTEYIQVNYAKASEMAAVLQSEDASLLSERASVTVDERTNTLLVRATAENLEQVRRLVSRLDVPVRQVLIESRIVIATDDFNKELGVRFGVNRDTTNSDGEGVIVGGNTEAITNLGNNAAIGEERFNVNLPANNPSGSIGLALAKMPFGRLLELELSAMQAEGRGEVVSNPRVITANQNEAVIKQGVQIPYQQAAGDGATSVSFQDAVLSLTVTPQITPDDRIVMDLSVTKDQVGQVFAGVPSIDTREVSTRVLVDNGETVVLGGIYEETQNEQVERVPFFGDLPIVGVLFRTRLKEHDKSELLVFVTPKIVKSASAGY